MTFAQRITTILHGLAAFLSGIFTKAGDELKTVIIPTTIAITNVAKTVLTLDGGDIIGHLAGTAGAALEDKARTALNSLAPKLQMAQQFLTLGNSTEILAATLKLVGDSVKETQVAFWIEFQAKLTYYMADGSLSIGEAYALGQILFPHMPDITVAPDPNTEEPA